MERSVFDNSRSQAFTLIEMMIVVVIIGILASVAIPSFMRYQLRTKSTEVRSNLAAIRIAEEATFAETGRYLPAVAEPPVIPGQSPADFNSATPDFAALGWTPEGRVYFSYAIAISADLTGYTADAAADIDGDGILQIWGYAKADAAGALVDGGIGCSAAFLQVEEIGSCVLSNSIY